MRMARIGCGQCGHKALKLVVSQEWIDEMDWFLHGGANPRKQKTCFNDFWVGQVRNGHGHLVYETLKSAE